MTEHLTEMQIIPLLAKACEDAGSQRAWAEANGLSPAFVNDVLQGKRAVTARIAGALNYTKFTGFLPKEDSGVREGRERAAGAIGKGFGK
jgi:hypothetical protein